MKYTIILLSFLIVTTVQSEPKKINKKETCLKIYKAAASALIGKKNGYTKQKMLSAIPSVEKLTRMPNSSQKLVLVAMYNILQEIFEYNDLDYWAYPVYRAEVCRLQLSGKNYPKNFSKSYVKLKKCTVLSTNDEKIQCGIKIALNKE